MTLITAHQSTSSAPINDAPTLPPIEPPKDTPQAEAVKPPQEDMSSKLVDLARREKIRRAQQIKLQSEGEAFARQQQEFEAKQKEYEQNFIPKDRVRTDLLGVLSEAGLNAEQIASLIQNPTNSLDLQLKSQAREIQELKSLITEMRKGSEDAQKNQYEQALNQIRYDVKNLISTDSSFELTKAMGAEEAVVELIKDVFEKGMGEKYPAGTVLDNTTAARFVEEQLTADATAMASIGKVKEKIAGPVKSAEVTQTTQPSTLTNAVAPTAPSAIPAKMTYRDLTKRPHIKTLTHQGLNAPQRTNSRRDKIARAIAQLEGKEI